jgi:predicted glycoside hydrolase/deacetylase ChbG (UPF0249 family)
VNGKRHLIVTADDFGIGPATSRGILELAKARVVTGTVLLVTSPYAEEAVQAWRQATMPLELGWHPCLTLDRPVLPAKRVPSLVGSDGCFHGLGAFLRRLSLGGIRTNEVAEELRAQVDRFRELVGHPPRLVNTHHHIQVFPPVGAILRELLIRQGTLPYLRRIHEPWRMLARIPGARVKRTVLSVLGRREARRQTRAGLPGNDWLGGITDPRCVTDPDFLTRWLRILPGRLLEWTCHPGHLDPTLLGRDCTADDGQMERRVREMALLSDPRFKDACERADLTLIAPTDPPVRPSAGVVYAA